MKKNRSDATRKDTKWANKKVAENIFGILEIYNNYKLEFVLCVFGIGVFLCFFQYFDGTSIQAWALETGDAFLRGGFTGFNEIRSQNLWNAPHGAVKDVFSVSNLIFTIWNLPVLLIHYFFKTEYSISFATRMWGEAFFVLLAVLCGCINDKIIYRITNSRKKGMMSAFLFWSSLSVFISVEYSMQDEIIYIFFILSGLYNAILERKSISLIWLSISCYTCPLMFVFAIPIVLFFSEKLFDTIYRVFVLVCVTTLQILYINLFTYHSSENQIEKIFDASLLNSGIGEVSIFAIVILIIYMLQWSIKIDGEKIKYLFWNLSFLSVMMYILGVLAFYRFLICVPFVLLSIMLLDSNQKQINAVLSLLLFEIIRIWHAVIKYEWILRLCDLSNSVKLFYGLYNYPVDTLGSVFRLIFPQILNTFNIVSGFIVALGIWILYICHPKQKEQIACPICIRTLTVIWSCTPIVFVMLVSIFLAKVNILDTAIKVDDNNLKNAKIISAIDGQNNLQEYYCGKSANKLLITVIPYTEEKTYLPGQKLNLDIIDIESGETISSHSYDISKIESGKEIVYRIEKIKMKKDHWYKFVFYSPTIIDCEEHYIRLFSSADGSANPQCHYAQDFSGVLDFDIVSRVITF